MLFSLVIGNYEDVIDRLVNKSLVEEIQRNTQNLILFIASFYCYLLIQV